MTPIQQCYAELLSLTQLFLLREHPLNEVKIVSPSLLTFFQKNMKSTPVLQAPKKVSSPTFASSLPIKEAVITTTPSDTRPTEPRPKPPLPNPTPPSAQPEPPPSPQPPPIIQQEKPNKITRGAKELALDPLIARSTPHDQGEFWKLFPNLFPEAKLSEAIPSDALAQKLKNAWQHQQMIPPVILLAFHDDEKQMTFLKNLAQAISLRLAPARVLSAHKLEKEKGWNEVLQTSSLRLVIASDYGLYLQPNLMQLYREVPQEGKHYLNQTPLLLLSDLNLYLKEPQLKSLLWRAICNRLLA